MFSKLHKSSILSFIIICFLLLPNVVHSQHFEWIVSQPVNYTHNPNMLNYVVATDVEDMVIYAGMESFNLNYSGMFGDLFF